MMANQTENSVISAKLLSVDNFLPRKDASALLDYTLSCEEKFERALVVQPKSNRETADLTHRRASVLYDTGLFNELILTHVRTLLPRILEDLSHRPFTLSHIETRITASNDGDFFKKHNDNSQAPIRTREISFVYYFFREPKAFSGGELIIYDTRREANTHRAMNTFKTVTPQQNKIVFFPSLLIHELLEVRCDSRAFADSRFTLNGWIRRQ